MDKKETPNEDWIDLSDDKFNWGEGDVIIIPPKDEKKEG